MAAKLNPLGHKTLYRFGSRPLFVGRQVAIGNYRAMSSITPNEINEPAGSIWQTVAAFREMADDQRRGYLFERFIREHLPWDFSPPRSVLTHTEQIDAAYGWRGRYFLVEAKAKRRPITPGSQDWEDFALKVREREGRCVGLYASLWPVSPGCDKAARRLNERGVTTLILAGEEWDLFRDHSIDIAKLLEYMLYNATFSYEARVKDLTPFIAWAEGICLAGN